MCTSQVGNDELRAAIVESLRRGSVLLAEGPGRFTLDTVLVSVNVIERLVAMPPGANPVTVGEGVRNDATPTAASPSSRRGG
jgi:hypothetical protein